MSQRTGQDKCDCQMFLYPLPPYPPALRKTDATYGYLKY